MCHRVSAVLAAALLATAALALVPAAAGPQQTRALGRDGVRQCQAPADSRSTRPLICQLSTARL